MAVGDYLTLVESINSSAVARTWVTELEDGRTIQICHQPMPDDGWVATHEDVTELKATRSVANELITLQTLIDWVPDYLWVKDAESRLVVVNKALASDSGRAKTSDMIGLTDFDCHAPEAARAFRALEHDNAPEVANYLGYSYRKLGDYDLAKVWYEKALAADPNHVRTWQYYGLWHLEQGNKLKAQDFLEKIRLLCGESCQDYLDLKGAIERGQHSY